MKNCYFLPIRVYRLSTPNILELAAAGLSSFSSNLVVIFAQPLLTLIERRKSISQLEPIDQIEVNTLTLGGQLAKN